MAFRVRKLFGTFEKRAPGPAGRQHSASYRNTKQAVVWLFCTLFHDVLVAAVTVAFLFFKSRRMFRLRVICLSYLSDENCLQKDNIPAILSPTINF